MQMVPLSFVVPCSQNILSGKILRFLACGFAKNGITAEGIVDALINEAGELEPVTEVEPANTVEE